MTTNYCVSFVCDTFEWSFDICHWVDIWNTIVSEHHHHILHWHFNICALEMSEVQTLLWEYLLFGQYKTICCIDIGYVGNTQGFGELI